MAAVYVGGGGQEELSSLHTHHPWAFSRSGEADEMKSNAEGRGDSEGEGGRVRDEGGGGRG